MKKISILGDSVSTFQNYTTPDGVFFDLFNISYAGMTSVEDTWWMRVIHGLGGQLEVNNSFSSTTVADVPIPYHLVSTDRYHRSPLYLSGCSDQRTSQLGNPDMILIYMGTNDAGYGIDAAAFERDYRLMLQKLKRNYPRAEIWCGTLLWSYCIKDEEIQYYNAETSASLDIYNEIIRKVVPQENCCLADMAASGEEYAAIDCAHPSVEGMETIATLWLRSMGAV